MMSALHLIQSTSVKLTCVATRKSGTIYVFVKWITLVLSCRQLFALLTIKFPNMANGCRNKSYFVIKCFKALILYWHSKKKHKLPQIDINLRGVKMTVVSNTAPFTYFCLRYYRFSTIIKSFRKLVFVIRRHWNEFENSESIFLIIIHNYL